MWSVNLLLLLLALLGHAFLWVALLNRVHSLAMPDWATHTLSLLCLGALVAVPLWLGHLFAVAGQGILGQWHWGRIPLPAVVYLCTCWVSSVATIAWWLRRYPLYRPPAVLRSHRTRSVEFPAYCTPASEALAHHFLVHMPGNQIPQLDVPERSIDVPRLPASLDGLSIMHLSDLHFTGRVNKSYFQHVVHRSNQMARG